jgi:hypothetical protein
VYGRLLPGAWAPGVAGALVELRDIRTGDVLAASPTSADGKYRASVQTEAEVEAELRVIDGRGEPLAEPQRLAVDAGATIGIDVAVPARPTSSSYRMPRRCRIPRSSRSSLWRAHGTKRARQQ